MAAELEVINPRSPDSIETTASTTPIALGHERDLIRSAVCAASTAGFSLTELKGCKKSRPGSSCDPTQSGGDVSLHRHAHALDAARHHNIFLAVPSGGLDLFGGLGQSSCTVIYI